MASADVARAKAKAAKAINLIISSLPCVPLRTQVTKFYGCSKHRDLVWLVVASRSVRHRYFAGIANIGDVSFHARLNAAFAGFGARAKLFHVIRTSFGIHGLEDDGLTAVGEVFDMRLEAVPDLSSARLNACAQRLGITHASAR